MVSARAMCPCSLWVSTESSRPSTRVVEVSSNASALTIMSLRSQESCLVSEHTNSEVTPIAHSRGNRRPSQKHECAREPPVGQSVDRILSILAHFLSSERYCLGQGY
jgi:hypothetical protein